MKKLPRLALMLIFCCCYQVTALAATCRIGRIPESTPTAAFDASASDGTVIHTSTGLMWSRCTLGKTWNNATSACDGISTTHTWNAALTAASASNLAGFTDWRVPNLKELNSIVERQCVNAAINDTIFPNIDGSFFWTASVFVNLSANSWGVNVNNGLDRFSRRNNTNRVRLVRGGQLFDSFSVSPRTVGGNITGLAMGNSVVLQDNGGDDLTVSANGSFAFITLLDDGSNYEVTVLTQPSGPTQFCQVIDGIGIIAGANITTVSITCTLAEAVPTLSKPMLLLLSLMLGGLAWLQPRKVKL